MNNIILSSQGFLKNEKLEKQLLKILPKPAKELKAAIITTASEEWKEKNKHAVAAKEQFEEMGFGKVRFVDVEFENPKALSDFDVIYINGGNPFYLLYHLKQSGADRVLQERANNGTIIVGVSAGGVVLGPNISIVDYFDSDLNTVGLKDLSGLNIIKTIIYPHYLPENEDQVKEFELKNDCGVARLSDQESIVAAE